MTVRYTEYFTLQVLCTLQFFFCIFSMYNEDLINYSFANCTNILDQLMMPEVQRQRPRPRFPNFTTACGNASCKILGKSGISNSLNKSELAGETNFELKGPDISTSTVAIHQNDFKTAVLFSDCNRKCDSNNSKLIQI